MDIVEEILEYTKQGWAQQVRILVNNALADGVPATVILEKGLMGAMNLIGEQFKRNECFVPEVLIAANAMNAGIEVLSQHNALNAYSAEKVGTVVLGTVKGDMHDIGKHLVRMMMESKGLHVIDIGVDAAPEKFVQTAIDSDASLIAASSLLTTTMGQLRELVDAVGNSPLCNKVPIMIGGAPTSQEFCDAIGADYYTPDAASAADLAYRIARRIKNDDDL